MFPDVMQYNPKLMCAKAFWTAMWWLSLAKRKRWVNDIVGHNINYTFPAFFSSLSGLKCQPAEWLAGHCAALTLNYFKNYSIKVQTYFTKQLDSCEIMSTSSLIFQVLKLYIVSKSQTHQIIYLLTAGRFQE